MIPNLVDGNFPCNVLSRLKGIETRTLFFPSGTEIACNVLSRLKGIETHGSGKDLPSFPLAMSFPVWRELKLCFANCCLSISRVLQCPFPFEGNWNQSLLALRVSLAPCNVLSRLKGIETFLLPLRSISLDWPFACNVLSRLKGIETLSRAR